MRAYQGYRSWNAWNVSLWMSNEYETYKFAVNCLIISKGNINSATGKFMRLYGGERTADGGIYTRLAVKIALEGIADGRDFS